MEVLVPGTKIWVDFFSKPGGVYFCTHAHADHLRGLTVSWRHGLLHCTRHTASYLIAKTRLQSQILRVHELEETFSDEDPGGTIATATFVDAGHCPGSIMVVFQFENQFVVITGDFRWHGALRGSPALQRVASAHCQLLCLDCTFANGHFFLNFLRKRNLMPRC